MADPFSEQRFGRLLIERHHWEDQDFARQVLARLVPVRVEYKMAHQAYEIDAYSPEFSPIKGFAVVPAYGLDVERVFLPAVSADGLHGGTFVHTVGGFVGGWGCRYHDRKAGEV